MKKISKRLVKRKTQSLLGYLSFVKSRIGIFAILVVLYCIGASAFAFQHSQQSTHSTPITKQPTSAKRIVAPPSQQQQPDTSSDTTKATPASNKSSVGSTASSYRPFVCRSVTIPHQTIYRNNDAMAFGETKLISQGVNGYVVSCTADSDGYTPPTNGMRVEPVSDMVDEGTGQDALRQQQADQALAERNQRYNLALAQCFQNLTGRGVPSGAAESACRSNVQY